MRSFYVRLKILCDSGLKLEVTRIDINILKGFINQRIKITLSNKRVYTGKITNIIGDTVFFIDKYENKITLTGDFIKLIVPEVKRGNENG